MKIVKLAGGLGNQMYQYTMYKCLHERSGDICFLDDSWFVHHHSHNGMELDRIFGVRPRWLRDEFSKDEWLELSKTMGRRSFFDKAKSLGLDINVVTDWCIHEESNRLYHLTEHPRGLESIWEIPCSSIGYDALRLTRLKGHFYFDGAWTGPNPFFSLHGSILRDFTFPPFDGVENESIAERIKNSNSVGLHVRRGDFVNLGRHTGASAYVSPVRKMKCALSNPMFFIFSDDIPWCRDNLRGLSLTPDDKVFFVDCNRGSDSFRDMQLMSMCKNLIRAHRSSFSSMASLLIRNPDKIIETASP